MLVYVDDLLLAGAPKEVKEMLNRLKDRFDIHDLGDATYFLGMEIKRDREERTLLLSQTKYTAEVLKRFEADDVMAEAVMTQP